MKLKFLTLILLGFFSLISSTNAKSYYKTDVPPNSTEIHLEGNLDYGASPNSVEAYYNSNMVVVCFHQNFGYVNILLVGETNNIVYNQTVNTALLHNVYIPIAVEPDGYYTLILTSVTGNAEGGFDK